MSLYVDTTYIHMLHEAPFLMLIVRYMMCFTHSRLSAVSFSIYVCDSPTGTYASKPAAPCVESECTISTSNVVCCASRTSNQKRRTSLLSVLDYRNN
jgi:hypothetical protein